MNQSKLAQIKGYEGLYLIDASGNVFSEITTNSRRRGIIHPFLNNSGYLRVGLFDKNGVRKIHYIHRLVAQAFLGNPKGERYVNHKDGNKQNNNVSNLEWCTQKANIAHSIAMGKQRNRKVLVVQNGMSKIYDSMRKASSALGKYEPFLALHMKGLKEFRLDANTIVKVLDE